jgi:hypothetical protein
MNPLCSLGPAFHEELWYSIVARYMRDRGYVNRQAAFEHLFGQSSVPVCMACPCGLPGLARQFELHDVCPAIDFCRLLTVVPYFLAFASSLPNDELAAANPLAVHDEMFSHWEARSPFRPHRLRYCRRCALVDIAAVGEAYWHRVHQLPGVFYCPDHGDRLMDSSVGVSPGRNNYWTAHQRRLQWTPVTRPGSQKATAFWQSIARYSRDILAAGPARPLFLGHTAYANLLRACGFAAKGGRVADGDLRKALAQHFHDQGLKLDWFGPQDWWSRAFTAVHGRLFPVQHIALRRFIALNLPRVDLNPIVLDRLYMHSSAGLKP